MRDPESLGSGFRDVDASADPNAYVKYLSERGSGLGTQLNKLFLVSLLEVGPSHDVLDVGCGLGDDASIVGKVLTEGGAVIGIDRSRVMIGEARQRIQGSGLPIDFLVVDAHHLTFPDATFDRCLAVQVLEHLTDPQQAFAEMARVTRPGGRILVAEPDWGTLTVSSSDRQVTRIILQSVSDRVIRNGWIGRQLAGMFVTSGFVDVSVVPSGGSKRNFAEAWHVYCLEAGVRDAVATGRISEAEAERWTVELEAEDRAGRFFASLDGFAVLGKKPERPV